MWRRIDEVEIQKEASTKILTHDRAPNAIDIS